jgi:hypothetical protein
MDVDRAAALYAEGRTTAEIAAMLGCSAGTVSKRLRAGGVVMRPPGPPLHTGVDTAEIVRLRTERHSWAEVAATVGITEAGARSRWARATKAAAAEAGQAWAGDQERNWQRRWAAVAAHRDRTGRWPTASDPDREVSVLGRWLATQRRAYRENRLSTSRVVTLTAAGFPLTAAEWKAAQRAAAPPTDQLAERYRDGASLDQLAVEYRLPVPRVRSIVVQSGGTIRPSRCARVPTQQLLEIQGWGASISQIAAMIGLSPGAVRARLRRAGPPHHNTGPPSSSEA